MFPPIFPRWEEFFRRLFIKQINCKTVIKETLFMNENMILRSSEKISFKRADRFECEQYMR